MQDKYSTLKILLLTFSWFISLRLWVFCNCSASLKGANNKHFRATFQTHTGWGFDTQKTDFPKSLPLKSVWLDVVNMVYLILYSKQRQDTYKHNLGPQPLHTDVDLGNGTDYCVYNIPVFPHNISLDPAGTRWKALWPNITVTAGVEAPISPVSLMFTEVWGEGGDNGETSAHLDKHLRVQSNATPHR